MKKLLLILLLIPNLAISLPKCKDGDSYWHDCFGIDESYGQKYVGEWKNDMRHGKGTNLFKGIKYVGEWKAGKFDGNGTMTYPNGMKYVGEFKNDKRHGKGTFILPNGKKFTGEWRKGEFLD